MSKPILVLPEGVALGLTEGQRQCVEVLREALEQAEAGKIYTIGIVVCMKEGYATLNGGTDAGSLNLGLDSLKRQILENVEGPSATGGSKQRSS